MNIKYLIIATVAFLVVCGFLGFIIKGRMKLKFVSQYWIIYLDYILFMILFYLLIALITFRFVMDIADIESEVSSLFFFITVTTFTYVISIGILFLFIRLFKTDGTFKNSITLRHALQYVMIFLPIINIFILFIIYTFLINSKEKVNAASDEVYV